MNKRIILQDNMSRLDALQCQIRQLLNTGYNDDFIKAKELQKKATILFNDIYKVKGFKTND